MSDNRPLSEIYRTKALAWVEADGAASLLEESRTVVLNQMINKVIATTPGISMSRAEAIARASSPWKDYVEHMVTERTRANTLKVEVEYLRMRHAEQQSSEASKRAEMRLT